MNINIYSEIFSGIRPLKLFALGRTWKLYSWFEPVWWNDGRLAALEMLTRPVDLDYNIKAKPELFFPQLSPQEQFVIMRWQLDILNNIKPWCADHGIPVSINVTRSLAILLLNDSSVQKEIINLVPHVRLEISENFLPSGDSVLNDPFLKRLMALAPLWLDDFGAGTTALSWLMSGMFESVKIDRKLIAELHLQPGGTSFLKSLAEFSRGMGIQLIAEGVENKELMDFALEAHVTACQGWLWPGVSSELLHTLPNTLSTIENPVYQHTVGHYV